jgi:hypothetical protein
MGEHSYSGLPGGRVPRRDRVTSLPFQVLAPPSRIIFLSSDGVFQGLVGFVQTRHLVGEPVGLLRVTIRMIDAHTTDPCVPDLLRRCRGGGPKDLIIVIAAWRLQAGEKGTGPCGNLLWEDPASLRHLRDLQQEL